MIDQWFSATLRYAVIVEGQGRHMSCHSLVLLRAVDFEEAQSKAVSVGLSREQRYANPEGRRVSWRLEEILTLDLLREGIKDGTEVFCRLFEESDPTIGPDTVFEPAISQPAQTI
jgi:hypothetical protein